VLIDIEVNGHRHFGFAETGKADPDLAGHPKGRRILFLKGA
jgi:hypothetical protein